MSVDEVVRGLDVASEKLEIVDLQHAHGLLEEANQALHGVASETNDQELAEVFGRWQQAIDEVASVSQICRAVTAVIANYRADLVGGVELGGEQAPGRPVGSKQPPTALIDSGKFRYFFGKVDSSKHSRDRSRQNVDELRRMGIFDTTKGREVLKCHLEEVLRSDSNIIDTYSDEYGNYQVRDSLLVGPGGFLQLKTTWQETDGGLRLTTMIPRRGKNW